MQINSIDSPKIKERYVQFYLSSEEFEEKEIKEKILKYKGQHYNIGIFITGEENYPAIINKIIKKEVERSKDV